MNIRNARPIYSRERALINKFQKLAREAGNVEVEIFVDEIILITERTRTEDITFACTAVDLVEAIEDAGAGLTMCILGYRQRYPGYGLERYVRMDCYVSPLGGEEAQNVANRTRRVIVDSDGFARTPVDIMQPA